MVATAIYSVTMVLWKETAFPLCIAMERRWKRNVVSRVSSVIVVIRLPISCVSSVAISCHVPAVSVTFIIIEQRLMRHVSVIRTTNRQHSDMKTALFQFISETKVKLQFCCHTDKNS